MQVFVPLDELPENCGSCPLHVGLDSCIMCPGKTGFTSIVGGSEGCPLQVLVEVHEDGTPVGYEQGSVDKSMPSGCRVILPEVPYFKDGDAVGSSQRNWVLVSNRNSVTDLRFRCPDCGYEVSIFSAVEMHKCSRCGVKLPWMEIHGPVGDLYPGAFLFQPYRSGSYHKIAKYKVLGFAYCDTGRHALDLMVRVEPIRGYDFGYVPLDYVPLSAIPGKFMLSWADADDALFHSTHDVYAFSGLYSLPVDKLDMTVLGAPFLCDLPYFARNALKELSLDGTLRGLLLCTDSDLKRKFGTAGGVVPAVRQAMKLLVDKFVD